jgi:hypothetical protein
MFTTATDYHELNAGVHRTRPKNISAPALAWHFAFWSRPNLAQEYGDPLEISKVRRSIDNLFVNSAVRSAAEVAAKTSRFFQQFKQSIDSIFFCLVPSSMALH